MKIEQIEVTNVLGAREVSIQLEAPIAIISGGNAAGKSSIADAVKMALSSGFPRITSTKKADIKTMVTEGAKTGGARVTTNVGAASFSLPAGEFDADQGIHSASNADALSFALDGQRFSRLSEKDRLTFLLRVSGVKISAKTISERLIKRDFDEEFVQIVAPNLLQGFDPAMKFAKEEVSKLRGSWQQLTGANYGSKIAETWEAEKLEPVACEYTDADIDALRTQIAEIDQNIGAAQEKKRSVANFKADLAKYQEWVDKLPSLESQLEQSEKDTADYQKTVEEMRAKAQGRKHGLIHDMAYIMQKMRRHADQLPAKLASDYTNIRNQYEQQYGPIADQVEDKEAQASLPEYERGLVTMQNRIANLKRDIETAKAAQASIDALAINGDPDADYDSEIAKLNAKKATLIASFNNISAEISHAKEIQHKIDTADQVTAEAAKIHADMLKWSALADALSPEGIPSEMLNEALKPFNKAMASVSLITDWLNVRIDKNANIISDDRPYALLSESEKWRADAMIAYAVATVSGLRIMLLDRMDVLEPKARTSFIIWMHELASKGLIDTAIICATLKAPAGGLPATMQQFWIENGTNKELKVAA